jgi:hypothetical protein
VGRCIRVLLGNEVHAWHGAQAGVPAVAARTAEHATPRAGHPGEQPPVVRRPLLRAAAAAAQGSVPRQVRVLHRQGHQGPGQPGILQRRRAAPDRPDGRRGERARAALRAARAGGGQRTRHLPRGHPVARRTAVPGPHRGGPAGPGVPGARRAVRDDEHVRVPAVRLAQPEVRHQAGCHLRQADGVLHVLRQGDGPRGAARGHRRDHRRDREAVRPGIRQYLRAAGEGTARGGGAAVGGGAAAGGPASYGFINVNDCIGSHSVGRMARAASTARLSLCEWEY